MPENTIKDFDKDALFAMMSETEKLANVGGWMWDIAQDSWAFSDNWLRIHGCTKRHLSTSELLQIAHPDDITDIQEAFDSAINKGTNYEIEHRIIQQNTGEERYVRACGSVQMDRDGKAVKIYGSAQDITEREKHEVLLRESEEKFRYLFDHSPIGKTITYVSGEMLSNNALAQMLGYSTDEFQNFTWKKITHPDDIELSQNIIESIISGEKDFYRFTKRYIHKNGTIVWADVSTRLQRDSEGAPLYFITAVIDITEREQAEEQLKKRHKMFERTESIAHLGSWEWDTKHDRVRWSKELFLIFGRDPSEGAPSFAKHSELFVAEDMQRLENAVENCVNQRKPYELELRAIRTDGEIRHCIGRGQAQSDKNGKILGLVGSFQDITDRKQVEKNLVVLEKRNQSLLDHSPVCHKIVDPDFNLQYMNDSGYRMLKLKSTDNLYGTPYPFDFFPESSRKELKEKLQEVKKSKKKVAFEAIACDSEGNKVWLYHSLIPVLKEKVGDIDFITVVSADVTEQKHMQERIRQSEKIESIGRLAGGVAHDFNNMLSVILGQAEMFLEDLDQDSPFYERTLEIKKAGERSASLTRQLLTFARKQTISPKVVDLNKTIEGTSNMLRRLIGEDIDLVWKPEKEVWPIRIDPSQIDQILTNLCVNARDAIADVGKVTIKTETIEFDETYCKDHPEFTPGEYVLLTVNDNGCGMDSETLSNIFEPFFTTKGSGEGTGLGLATVYGAVKQNHGFVNVYSEPDHGTTFRIYFPRYRTKAEVFPEEIKDISFEKGHETILLVEDEKSILDMTRTMLNRFGYHVISAASPGEAIHLAQEHTGEIHLLITDVVMPEMNGRDLAKNILSMYPEIRRLFMSGYSEDVIAHHGVLDEGVNFIEKPFSRKQLGIKIREALDKVES